MGQRNSKYTVWVVLSQILLAATLLFCAIGQAHCTTKTQKPNTFGAIAYVENPNSYMYGSVIDGSVMVDNKSGEWATSIRFNPAHTFMLFSESVLFCGNQAARFNTVGKRGVVVTYQRRARVLFQGVACHDIESVDVIESAVTDNDQ